MSSSLQIQVTQQPLESFEHKCWDVAVVGAGPSGTMAAFHLSKFGYDVLLIDRHKFPRDKVCGDALIPDALHCLQKAGIYDHVKPHGHSLSMLRIFSPSRHKIDIPGDFLTIKRESFDQILVQEAVSAGSILAYGKVEDIIETGVDRVQLTHSNGSGAIKARVVVVATGADVSLLQKLNKIEEHRPSATALRCYIKSEYKIDHILVSYDQSIIPGYAWIFPMGDGEYNVGCGLFYRDDLQEKINLKRMFQVFMDVFPEAKCLMEKGEIVSPIKGARLRCGLSGITSNHETRIVPIGETIGTTFPFTGEGIGKAMETGIIAAEAIHESFSRRNLQPLIHFPQKIERTLRPRYRGYKMAESWLARAWLNDFMARRVQKSPLLQHAVSGILNETVDPAEVFSIKSILRSFWK